MRSSSSPFRPHELPSSFLPYLPRSQTTLSPLIPQNLIRQIDQLRAIYLPLIHGAFGATDIFDSDEKVDVSRNGESERTKYDTTLAGSAVGLGLGLNIDSSSGGGSVDEILLEQIENDESVDDMADNAEDDSSQLDTFEREWAERWLNGVIRRAQNWLEAQESLDEEQGAVCEDGQAKFTNMEAVLREATAVLEMMAGTSAAGSLTRHLLFPVDPSFSPLLRLSQQSLPADPTHSPETTAFLASLSVSPDSPLISSQTRPGTSTSPEMRAPAYDQSLTARCAPSNISSSPRSSLTSSRNGKSRIAGHRAAIPIILHDAPMVDHQDVGVQTWGSAILLGREMALRPDAFGLLAQEREPRVLELGAGTGLLSILCRKLLDLHHLSMGKTGTPSGLVVASDFHKMVLSNLRICIDLNFPFHPHGHGFANTKSTDRQHESGIHVAKLDWATFPHCMATNGGLKSDEQDAQNSMQLLDKPFDLVLASDCVYEPSHASMLRQVTSWVLRTPSPDKKDDNGGTFHILSPLRPTFTPELESIDANFPPLSSYPPTPLREGMVFETRAIPEELLGEGLGRDMGLKLGVREKGKRAVKGRKGEGRADEIEGYWWWEIGWG